MKNWILFSILLFSSNALATDFPFEVIRDADGTIDSVHIKKRQIAALEADAFIESLKAGSQQMNAMGAQKWEGFEKLKPEEQQAYLDSQNMLHAQSLASALDDKQLREEFAKVVRALKSKKLFYLMASPNRPGDFDGENLLEELVGRLVDAAQKVLGTSPIFNVFEFLVEEYFEALISRREFMQNVLLAYLQTDVFGASEAEKSAIRSSIFYSRIAIYNLPARKKAVKTWATYGDKKQSKWLKRCKTTSQTYLHSCFRYTDDRIYNLVDGKYKFSKKPSIAFSYKSPRSVGNERWAILAAKLALKLVPLPSLVTKPVEKWLESLYKDQRRTEGLLFGSTYMAGENAMSAWIHRNTANPTLKF